MIKTNNLRKYKNVIKGSLTTNFNTTMSAWYNKDVPNIRWFDDSWYLVYDKKNRITKDKLIGRWKLNV